MGAAMDKHSSRMGDSSWRSNHLGQHVDPDVTAVKANDTIPKLNQEKGEINMLKTVINLITMRKQNTDEDQDWLPSLPRTYNEIALEVYLMSPEQRKRLGDLCMCMRMHSHFDWRSKNAEKVRHVLAAITIVDVSAELVGEEGLWAISAAFDNEKLSAS